MFHVFLFLQVSSFSACLLAVSGRLNDGPVCWDSSSAFLQVKRSFRVIFSCKSWKDVDLRSFTLICTCCGQKPVRHELGETVFVNLTSVNLPAAGLLLLSFCPGVLTLQSRVLLFLVKSPSVTGGRCFQRSLWWFHRKSVCMKSRLCPFGAVCPDPYYQDCRRFWVWCVMIGLLKWRCARRNIRSMNPPGTLVC